MGRVVWANLLTAAVLLTLCVWLYHIKYQAEALSARNQSLSQKLQREKAMVRLFYAEWSYLNSPAKLQSTWRKVLADTKAYGEGATPRHEPHHDQQARADLARLAPLNPKFIVAPFQVFLTSSVP